MNTVKKTVFICAFPCYINSLSNDGISMRPR
jgi:hypothetical protein